MSNDLELTMQELAKSLTVMNYDYADFKKDTIKKLNEHDDILRKRVYLASNEARIVRDTVKEKVKEICKENNIDYHKEKSKMFPRVYRELNDKFQVATYRELPSMYFKEIIQTIQYTNINIQDILEMEKTNAS